MSSIPSARRGLSRRVSRSTVRSKSRRFHRFELRQWVTLNMLFNNAVIPAVRSALSEAIHTALSSRYFRRNEGTTDYANIPAAVTSTNCSISFDIYTNRSSVFYVFGNSSGFTSRISISTNGSFNVRTSTNNMAFDAPANTIPVNIWTNVRLELSSGVLEVFINSSSIGSNSTGGVFKIGQLFRNSTSVSGTGILANLKIWDNGTLIRDYPLDDNSDDLRELVSGQNGTVINGNASDWGVFQQQVTGEWLGQELATVTELTTVDIGGPFISTYKVGTVLSAGIRVRISTAVTNYLGTSSVGFADTLGIGTTPRLSSNGNIYYEFTSSGVGDINIFNRTSNQCTFDNISVKEVLDVA